MYLFWNFVPKREMFVKEKKFTQFFEISTTKTASTQVLKSFQSFVAKFEHSKHRKNFRQAPTLRSLKILFLFYNEYTGYHSNPFSPPSHPCKPLHPLWKNENSWNSPLSKRPPTGTRSSEWFTCESEEEGEEGEECFGWVTMIIIPCMDRKKGHFLELTLMKRTSKSATRTFHHFRS